MFELIVLPLIIGFVIFAINWLEFNDQDQDVFLKCLIGLGGLIFVLFLIFCLGKMTKTYDTEVLNGQVVSKERNIVHCRHSYECHCHEDCSGHGRNRSCWEHCDTCYEHPYDVDWDVLTDLNETFTIDPIDPQGLIQPNRWTRTRIGDPVAALHSFINYVKAANFSLYHDQIISDKKMLSLIPNYPDGVYDYYNLDRVITINYSLADRDKWNRDLAMLLEKLGPQKQANVIIVIVNSNRPSWAVAVRNKWHGAKKNDVIVTIGVDNSRINWVDVYSWSDSSIFKIKLRDDIKDIGNLDEDKILAAIDVDTMKYFQRKHMRDFKYLKGEIEPGHGLMVFLWVLSIFGSFGALGAFLFINVEKNNSERRYYNEWSR